MKAICKCLAMIGVGLFILVWGVTMATAQELSSNIPLDSYIYTYLDKLDGLGYLDIMMPSTKPYTRLQAAVWVKQMAEKADAARDLYREQPSYVRSMFAVLQQEFRSELDILAGAGEKSRFALKETTLATTYYDGQFLTQHRTESTYQPLNINNNGYQLGNDFNEMLTVRAEGVLTDYFLLSLTPRLSYDREEDFSSSLESGYFKTKLGNYEFQLGRDAMWWGPGVRGSLPLTNNSVPKTALKISNIEPVKFGKVLHFLGERKSTFFYGKLKDNRSDETDVADVGFTGFRMDITPTENLTIGGAVTSMVGGKGHEFGLDDLGDLVRGKNASNSEDDKWNNIAGLDFSWRLPYLEGVRIYGELYGEDEAGFIIPFPSKNAYLLGVNFPRLTTDGRWDLQLEGARTSNCWYIHSTYRDGYVDDRQIMGDAMGYNADRFYFKLTRYLDDGSWLAFNGEYVRMDKDAANSQTVNTLWVTYYRVLEKDLTLRATIGAADIDNLDYQSGKSDHDYLMSVGVTKKF